MGWLMSIFDLSNDTDNPHYRLFIKGEAHHTCGTLLTRAPERFDDRYYCGLCNLRGWLKKSEQFPEAEWV